MITLTSFSCQNLTAQKGVTADQIVLRSYNGGTSDQVVPYIECAPLPGPLECANLITNNNFTPNSNYNPQPIGTNPDFTDPFTTPPHAPGFIPNWMTGQGTPQIDDYYSRFFFSTVTMPPAPATGYAAMFGGTTGGIPINEGIIQKISPLTIGAKYMMSFFERISLSPNYTNTSMNFNIVLMKCNDYGLIYPPAPNIYITPPNPANSQTIYCEVDLQNTQWLQKTTSFIANDDYDVIWIYPKGDPTVNSSGAMILFALPELINVTGFTAGANPTPTLGNCTVTIGPSTPNPCGFTNAVYTWYGPNGQIIPAPSNQQIPVDASNPSNVGTWTLVMSAANETPTTNVCRQALSSTVVVPSCPSCANPAQIISTSYYETMCTYPPTYYPIIPNSVNTFCFPWECGDNNYLETNHNAGNRWYINGILIPDNFYGNISGVGFVSVFNNSKNIVHRSRAVAGNHSPALSKFEVKNETMGCGILSPPTYIFNGRTLFPTEHITSYKPNYTTTITTPGSYDLCPGTTYTWSVPDAVVTDVDPTTPQASIYFPSNIPIPTVTGTLTVSNSPYCNGTYNIVFNYNPNLRSPESETDEIFVSAYPNPTNGLITISANEIITKIEISSLRTSTFKSMVSSAKTVTVSLSDLPTGIYNCKVFTSKGFKNQKIILK